MYLVRPTNVTITPLLPFYQSGDELTCRADGRPEPTYHWTDLVTGNSFDGSLLVLSEDFGGSHHFRCTAINDICGRNEKESEDITITVKNGLGRPLSLQSRSIINIAVFNTSSINIELGPVNRVRKQTHVHTQQTHAHTHTHTQTLNTNTHTLKHPHKPTRIHKHTQAHIHLNTHDSTHTHTYIIIHTNKAVVMKTKVITLNLTSDVLNDL